jgi:hypothetical protein
MFQKLGALCSLLAIAMFGLFSCEEEPVGHNSDVLSFPVGRSFLSASTIDVTIADKAYHTNFEFDNCGGYWLHIPKSEVVPGDNIKIRFARKSEDLQLFLEIVGDKQEWVSPSVFIDSDHEVLVAKARELTDGVSGDIEKAKRIQTYVVGHVYLKIYFDASHDKASLTNELGYGTCMNSSRLFVALCRAVNIPARTVWGVVNAHDDIGGYTNHHQWAEMLDESGFWHPMDFGYTTYFDLNDITYTDLLYAAEENIIIQNRDNYHIMFEDLHYVNYHPSPTEGKLWFRMISDSRPDSMVIVYSYEYLPG